MDDGRFNVPVPANLPFGGDWAESGVERRNLGAALRALWDAVLRCPNEPMADDVSMLDALHHIEGKLGTWCPYPAALRKAFALEQQQVRFLAARTAYVRMFNTLWLAIDNPKQLAEEIKRQSSILVEDEFS